MFNVTRMDYSRGIYPGTSKNGLGGADHSNFDIALEGVS